MGNDWQACARIRLIHHTVRFLRMANNEFSKVAAVVQKAKFELGNNRGRRGCDATDHFPVDERRYILRSQAHHARSHEGHHGLAFAGISCTGRASWISPAVVVRWILCRCLLRSTRLCSFSCEFGCSNSISQWRFCCFKKDHNRSACTPYQPREATLRSHRPRFFTPISQLHKNESNCATATKSLCGSEFGIIGCGLPLSVVRCAMFAYCRDIYCNITFNILYNTERQTLRILNTTLAQTWWWWWWWVMIVYSI